MRYQEGEVVKTKNKGSNWLYWVVWCGEEGKLGVLGGVYMSRIISSLAYDSLA